MVFSPLPTYQEPIVFDADAIWTQRLTTYPDRFKGPDLEGETAEVPAHVELIGQAGVLLGGIDCVVSMQHDGDDWEIAAVTYRSEFGGPSHDFDVALLKSRAADGTLADLAEREILRLIDGQYNALADAATRETRKP